MKFSYTTLTLVLCLAIATTANANTVYVSSLLAFNNAQTNAAANDSIVWENGNYTGIYLNITKSNLYIGAENWGGVVFSGASRVRITGDYITLEGFQFVGGDIGTNDIINTYGSYNHFNQLNLTDYTCYKYLRIREECQYNRVTYCNFENRLNLDDQNILSILVDENTPGYHKIQYCSFKNFDGIGNDMGIEPIRIGLSTQADHVNRSLVEYCYFTACDGDGELISSKARQTVYRFNTFENNTKAELVLRHGSEAIVYGNFFINGKGGVRVREGQNHYIYNNHFYQLEDRAIYLQNDDSDPLDNINIAFNTIVDCAEVILGGDGNYPPTNVTFANNIFANPNDDLFEEATGNETWINNMVHGSLGISLPAAGLEVMNPLLVQNEVGFYGLAPLSPAVNAAEVGYALLPQFEGMDAIDTDISFDLMQQNRPPTPENKDLGCSEYPHNTLIQPIATDDNTGPDYTNPVGIGEMGNAILVDNLIHVQPNPVSQQVVVTLNTTHTADVEVSIFDVQGRLVMTLFKGQVALGEKVITHEIDTLGNGVYIVRASSQSVTGKQQLQMFKVIKQ